MANCITCRHNDKKAKYCPVKKAHTDLGYVLNCIAWAPTDEDEMKRLRTENAKLRKLVRDIYGEYRYLRVRFHRIYVHHEERMRAIEQRMRELGVEVD